MNSTRHRPRTVLALSLLVAAGCGGNGSSSPRRTFEFREGIITFSNPKPRSNVRELAKVATRIVLTTRTREGALVTESQGIVGSTGKVGNRSPQEIFRRAAKRGPKVLTTDQFAFVWKKLVDVGILDLPRSRTNEAPTDAPSIQVSAEGKNWIFLKPVRGFQQDRTVEERKLNAAWAQAKVIISEASTL